MTELSSEFSNRNRLSFLNRLVEKSSLLDISLNYVGVAFTVLLALMTVVAVLSRYLFNRPITAYVDLMEMMMAIMVFLCIPFCQLRGGHIRFEFFMDAVFKTSRAKYLNESLLLLLSLAGFVFIAVNSLNATILAYSINDVTLAAYLPTWPAKMCVAAGSISLCLRLLIQLLQNIALAIANK